MRKNLGIIGTVGLAVSLALSGCSSGPTQLEEIYESCGEPYGFFLEDNGKTLSYSDSDDVAYVACVLYSLDAPEWFWIKWGDTTTRDGWQEASFGDFTVEWSYHYEYGMSGIIRENSNKKPL